MKALEYSNLNHVNIIPKEDFEELIHETFEIVASNLAKSLGPLGSNATILNGMMTDATKDGHTIFKNYIFHNRYKQMIYNLISAPCTRLNNTVGDGTTTAIVLTNYLFKHYKLRKNQLEVFYRLPRQFTKAWDEMISMLTEKVQGYATPLDPSDYQRIYDLCYVTSNGSEEISKNIADTYQNGKAPVIKLKDSPTSKSYITPITGFEFPGNLISEQYAKNEDLSVEHRDICVMIFDHKIETDLCQNFIFPINEMLKKLGKKLLIVAPYYDAYLADTVLKQYVNYEYQKEHELNLMLAQYALKDLQPHQLEDLAIISKTQIINQDTATRLSTKLVEASEGAAYDLISSSFSTNAEETKGNEFYGMIGEISYALMSCTNGCIFKPNGIEDDERYKGALLVAEKFLADTIAKTSNEKTPYAYEVAKAQARVSQLKMENYIYYIGGEGALQKRVTWDSVEDVVKCVRSAIKSGTVPGCQLSITKAALEIMQELSDGIEDVNKAPDNIKLRIAILEIIQDAVVNTYAAVLHGPDGRGMIKLIPRWQHTNQSEEALIDLVNTANDHCNEIIKKSMEDNVVFDLETLEYNPNIITSAETDIQVLLASSDLVKILISGNQCVFLDTEINDSHNDTVPVYM